MKFRQFHVLISTLCALALTLTACATKQDNTRNGEMTTTATASAETAPFSPVDSITLEGEAPTKPTFAQTYARYTATVLHQQENEPTFDELGEQLLAVETERDAAVEAMLEITLARETTNDMQNEVIRRVQAGESPDLLAFSSAQTAASLAQGGYLADLGSLGTFSPDNPALDQQLNNALTIAGRSYFLFGDATVGDKAATAVLLLDRAAAEAEGISLDALIDTIHEGAWTTEALLELAANHEGLLGFGRDAVLPLFQGAGGKLFAKDANDIPAISIDDSFRGAYAAMQEVMAETSEDTDAIFTVGTLDDLTDNLTALPLPSVQAGEAYCSAVDPAAADCISIPAAPNDPARTGDILTAYFTASTDTVAAVLYDSLAEFCRDDVLDCILTGRDCSLGALFGWGDLPEALADSIGQTESAFLASAEMRLTTAAKAMEIFLNRLT